MKTKLVIVLMGALVLFGSVAARGATEAQKQAAIDAGLAYLASTQAADGHWEYGDDYYDTAATGAALFAFLEEGYTGSDAVVQNGLSYLFSKAQTYAVGVEPAGDPDLDGDGLGVKFVLGGDINRDTYVTGLAATAIARTGTPSAVVNVPGSQVDGWTYGQVMRDVMDYFAYGQADPGNNAQGGWRYYADYGQSDNSTAQWPEIAALVSGGYMGQDMAPFVKTELEYWINYIQNADGGSAYDGTTDLGGGARVSNMSRTGALLIEMIYCGWPTTGTAQEQADVAAALAYINGQWDMGANATWNGNFGHPYAMWAVYKGLEGTIGLDDTTTITPRAQGGAVIDPGDTWNWWEDYCEYLVTTQAANGSWGGYSYWTGPMATSWYINILAATEIPPPPVIPEPVTMAGLMLGIGGLVTYIRRRK